jgi:hypothetical protein
MNRPPVLDFGDEEPAPSNANVDASVLDEDAWEDATDELDVNSEMLYQSRSRSSMFDD